jgi:hypothetical protein
MADIGVVAVLVCALALIVRGMMRGSIRTCDTSCGGDCASCGHACSTPRLHLTDEQLAQLAELDKRSGVRR